MECIQKFVDDNQQESGSAIFNSTSSLESHEKALLALDVVARHRPTSFIPLGRSLFLEKGATPIAHGVELWNGFHQSMRVAQSQLLMNVNTTTAAFYQPGKRNVINYGETTRSNTPNQKAQPWKQLEKSWVLKDFEFHIH